MSIYTVENFTSDITVEGYIAEFRFCFENLRFLFIGQAYFSP